MASDGPELQVVVIGGSAGGLEALVRLLHKVPADFPGAIFVVLHTRGVIRDGLVRVLGKAGPLKTVIPEDGDPILPGMIYVAPPDFHLLVEPGRVRLTHGPMENRSRPAIDPLFRTAAKAYGPCVIGIVLSGLLDDGASGLATIKRSGGIAVVQDPADALFTDMPRNAMQTAPADHVLPAAEMSTLLARLVGKPCGRKKTMSKKGKKNNGNGPTATPPGGPEAVVELKAVGAEGPQGEPSMFSCPECGGRLWELRKGKIDEYRCQVGHGFTAANLFESQNEAIERSVWTAIRTFEERSRFSERLARIARDRNNARMAAYYDEQAEESRRNAENLRKVTLKGSTPPEDS